MMTSFIILFMPPSMTVLRFHLRFVIQFFRDILVIVHISMFIVQGANSITPSIVRMIMVQLIILFMMSGMDDDNASMVWMSSSGSIPLPSDLPDNSSFIRRIQFIAAMDADLSPLRYGLTSHNRPIQLMSQQKLATHPPHAGYGSTSGWWLSELAPPPTGAVNVSPARLSGQDNMRPRQAD